MYHSKGFNLSFLLNEKAKKINIFHRLIYIITFPYTMKTYISIFSHIFNTRGL